MASIIYIFVLMTSFSFMHILAKSSDVPRSELKAVNPNFYYGDSSDSDKPLVRIKKDIIKTEMCSEGTIYYMKQCKSLDEIIEYLDTTPESDTVTHNPYDNATENNITADKHKPSDTEDTLNTNDDIGVWTIPETRLYESFDMTASPTPTTDHTQVTVDNAVTHNISNDDDVGTTSVTPVTDYNKTTTLENIDRKSTNDSDESNETENNITEAKFKPSLTEDTLNTTDDDGVWTTPQTRLHESNDTTASPTSTTDHTQVTVDNAVTHNVSNDDDVGTTSVTPLTDYNKTTTSENIDKKSTNDSDESNETENNITGAEPKLSKHLTEDTLNTNDDIGVWTTPETRLYESNDTTSSPTSTTDHTQVTVDNAVIHNSNNDDDVGTTSVSPVTDYNKTTTSENIDEKSTNDSDESNQTENNITGAESKPSLTEDTLNTTDDVGVWTTPETRLYESNDTTESPTSVTDHTQVNVDNAVTHNVSNDVDVGTTSVTPVTDYYTTTTSKNIDEKSTNDSDESNKTVKNIPGDGNGSVTDLVGYSWLLLVICGMSLLPTLWYYFTRYVYMLIIFCIQRYHPSNKYEEYPLRGVVIQVQDNKNEETSCM